MEGRSEEDGKKIVNLFELFKINSATPSSCGPTLRSLRPWSDGGLVQIEHRRPHGLAFAGCLFFEHHDELQAICGHHDRVAPSIGRFALPLGGRDAINKRQGGRAI
jgi:hypothetical protein